MEQENRTAIVKLRLTPREKDELKIRAEHKGMTMSDYIRTVSAKPPAVTRKEYEESLERAIYEIHKIGVNINQIAKKYNENNYVKPSERLLIQLEKVNVLTEKIKECLIKQTYY